MKSAITLEETTPASLFPAPLLAGNEQLGDLLLEQNQPEQALEPMKLPCRLPQIVSIASPVLDELQNWQVLVRRLRLITVNF